MTILPETAVRTREVSQTSSQIEFQKESEAVVFSNGGITNENSPNKAKRKTSKGSRDSSSNIDGSRD